MPDGYNSPIYFDQSGNLVVTSGANITFKSGASLALQSGATMTAPQAGAYIADLAAITGGQSPTEAEHNEVRTAINGILAILVNNGMMLAGP